MPEMVSMFNGMGGACAALISIVEFNRLVNHPTVTSLPPSNFLATAVSQGELLIILLGLIIGSVSFAGSMIAWGKLNGGIKDFSFKGQHIINLVILFGVFALAVYLFINVNDLFRFDGTNVLFTLQGHLIFYGVFVLALLYGIFFVMPIGGADMPVVISLLNSLPAWLLPAEDFYTITK